MSTLELSYSKACTTSPSGVCYPLSAAQRRDPRIMALLREGCAVYLTGDDCERISGALRPKLEKDTLLLRPSTAATHKEAVPGVWHRGVPFDSVQEARFAEMMAALGVRFEPHPLTVSVPDINGRSVYTPDFYVHDLSLFVEIKPRRPDLATMERCAALSVLRPDDAVACIYGNFRPPVTPEVPRSYSFAHADGLAAMVWRGGQLQGGVGAFVVRSGVLSLQCVVDRQSAAGFDHPALLAAYQKAAELQFTPP